VSHQKYSSAVLEFPHNSLQLSKAHSDAKLNQIQKV